MARCPHCEYPLPDDRDRVGSRCPHCREPLYEPAGRFARPAREGEAVCAAHAGMETVGVCARCGHYLCEACRTRWRGQVVCVACINKALHSGEATPEQERAHFRQAVLAMSLGGGAWALSLLAAWLGWRIAGPGGTSGRGVVLIFLVVLVVIADAFVAAVGVGNAAAALRTRGKYMALALVGLIVSGLYVGAFLGVGALGLWQQ
jgi:hypothetical protein